jgi:hypothetical protein
MLLRSKKVDALTLMADWILLESGEIAWVQGTRTCYIEARDTSLPIQGPFQKI